MKKVVLIMAIASLLFCGCDAGYNRFSAGASGFDCEMCVIQNGIPYTGDLDLRLNTITLLETDIYGRQLFFYRMSKDQQSILFVVQKVDEPVVYYYEDDCYMLRQIATHECCFNDDDKTLLKERNDWDQPLNAEKMYSVTCVNPADYENIPDNVRTVSAVEQEFLKLFPEKDLSSSSVSLNGLETYPGFGQVALFCIWAKGECDAYIVLLDHTHSPKIRAISPAGDLDDSRENIIAFKDTYCKG